MSFEDRPFRAAAVDLLRAEQDVVALDGAIGAFAAYSNDNADLSDIVLHARHPAAEHLSQIASPTVSDQHFSLTQFQHQAVLNRHGADVHSRQRTCCSR